MQQHAESWMTLHGIKLRYLDKGQGDQAILLIHGLGCSAMEWSENLNALSEKHRVIAIDLVGFGKSDRPKSFEYTPEGQARVLYRLAQSLQLNKIHLVGNSYGGLVAIAFAQTTPHLAASLTLVNSAGGGSEAPLPMRLSTIPGVGEWMRKVTRDAVRAGFQIAMYKPDDLDEARVEANYMYACLPGSNASFLATVRGILNLFGFRDRYVTGPRSFLEQTQVPTLILWGRHDQLLPVAHAEHFHAVARHSTLHIFEDCGHGPMFEAPSAFNDVLTRFIATQTTDDDAV